MAAPRPSSFDSHPFSAQPGASADPFPGPQAGEVPATPFMPGVVTCTPRPRVDTVPEAVLPAPLVTQAPLLVPVVVHHGAPEQVPAIPPRPGHAPGPTLTDPPTTTGRIFAGVSSTPGVITTATADAIAPDTPARTVESGWTRLHVAVINGDCAAIQSLLGRPSCNWPAPA